MSFLQGRPHRARRRCNANFIHSSFTASVHPSHQLPQYDQPLIIQLYYYCHKILNNFNVPNRLVFCIFIILLSCTVCHAHPRHRRDDSQISDKSDFVCNVGDAHECVCSRFSGNLDGKLKDCTQYFGVKKLPVIKITLKKINLEDRLHTNETYQQYFRRRVAYLISDYCEHQANDCPGTTLRMTKVDSNFTIETTTQLFLDDHSEPSITQENIVIVRVNFLPRDRVELYVAISKNYNDLTMDENTTMDPEKVKYILSAQIGPLSRILGGVYIEELKTDSVKRVIDEDNTRLLTLIVCIGIAFSICYAIAVYRCCVQTRKKRNRQKKNHQQQKYGPNYGTCTDKLLNYDKPNGKIKTTSITSKESISSGRRDKKSSDVRTPTIELKTPTFDDDRPSLDARSFKRMFACDPSQLPAEIIYVTPDADAQSDDLILQSPPSKKNSSPITQEGPQIPSMILVSAGTPIPPEFGANHVPKTVIEPEAQQIFPAGPTLLDTGNGYAVFERPLSRRGSRNSTPEQGEEFGEDDREDTPLPLGDDENDVFVGDKMDSMPTPEVVIQTSTSSKKRNPWSSGDSESDQELYQRLSEASEPEEDEKMLNDEEGKAKKFKNISKNNNSSDPETSDEEEKDEKTEEEMLNRHTYERLHESESPVPPVNIPANLLELDSTP